MLKCYNDQAVLCSNCNLMFYPAQQKLCMDFKKICCFHVVACLASLLGYKRAASKEM